MTELEAEIQTRLWERTLPYIRLVLLLAALLFLGFLAWDRLMHAGGQTETLALRLATAGFFVASYWLVAHSRFGRRYIPVIYIADALVATVMALWILLKLPHGYELGHSSFLVITMVIMVIGPTRWVSIPLALASLLIPNLGVLVLIGAGVEMPGMPTAWTALTLGVIHLGAAVVVVGLITIHDRLQRRILLDNVHLEQLASTDPLTALENRRQLQSEFERERARQRRHKQPIGVLELDIDHFKRINDSHGHGVGDEVLRSLAQRWRSLIRGVDVLARIGGEEFVVLMPETSAEGARQLAERLRASTASQTVPTSAGELDITISVGIALATLDGGGLDKVLERADQALYQAKRNGRNRCEIFEAEQDAAEASV